MDEINWCVYTLIKSIETKSVRSHFLNKYYSHDINVFPKLDYGNYDARQDQARF